MIWTPHVDRPDAYWCRYTLSALFCDVWRDQPGVHTWIWMVTDAGEEIGRGSVHTPSLRIVQRLACAALIRLGTDRRAAALRSRAHTPKA